MDDNITTCKQMDMLFSLMSKYLDGKFSLSLVCSFFFHFVSTGCRKFIFCYLVLIQIVRDKSCPSHFSSSSIMHTVSYILEDQKASYGEREKRELHIWVWLWDCKT